MKKTIALIFILVCVLSTCGCSSGAASKALSKNDMAEWAIANLKSKITFEDHDILTFSNGLLYSIDIKSEETAEILFQCIRNCRSITDLTGAALAPEHLPILINGKELGSFERIYSEYPETGQFFSFNFTEDDSTAFYEYVMALEN